MSGLKPAVTIEVEFIDGLAGGKKTTLPPAPAPRKPAEIESTGFFGLTRAKFDMIESGMTEGEVTTILGSPCGSRRPGRNRGMVMEEATQEQKRAIRGKLDTFSRHVGRRTVMFLWEDENGIPRQEGTGVLLAIGNRRFVITAAHVADQIKFESDAGRLTFIAGCGMVEERPIRLIALH